MEPLDFLSAAEKRTLNQIRGNAYLCRFSAGRGVHPPIPDGLRQALLQGDDYRVRALLQFAGEEAKHIHLFKLFCEEFEKGFGDKPAVIGPPEAIAQAILAHDPLAVALTILHIEWMTQRHYQESVKDDQELDLQFKSLLKHHWMEEAQHAKLDTLVVEALSEGRAMEKIATAIEEYIEIGGFIDGGLAQQTQFDLTPSSAQRAAR